MLTLSEITGSHLAGVSQIPEEMNENFPLDILSWTRNPKFIFPELEFEKKTFTELLTYARSQIQDYPKEIQSDGKRQSMGTNSTASQLLGSEVGIRTMPLGQCHAYEPGGCRERGPSPGNPGTWVLESALP